MSGASGLFPLLRSAAAAEIARILGSGGDEPARAAPATVTTAPSTSAGSTASGLAAALPDLRDASPSPALPLADLAEPVLTAPVQRLGLAGLAPPRIEAALLPQTILTPQLAKPDLPVPAAHLPDAGQPRQATPQSQTPHPILTASATSTAKPDAATPPPAGKPEPLPARTTALATETPAPGRAVATPTSVEKLRTAQPQLSPAPQSSVVQDNGTSPAETSRVQSAQPERPSATARPVTVQAAVPDGQAVLPATTQAEGGEQPVGQRPAPLAQALPAETTATMQPRGAETLAADTRPQPDRLEAKPKDVSAGTAAQVSDAQAPVKASLALPERHHVAFAVALASAVDAGGFPLTVGSPSSATASVVIFNAAMIPSWPPAQRFDAATAQSALSLAGADMAKMSPEEAAEYLAKMAGAFGFLLTVKKRLSQSLQEEKEALLGLFSFLGVALDCLAKGLQMAFDLTTEQRALLAEITEEMRGDSGARSGTGRGRQRLHL